MNRYKLFPFLLLCAIFQHIHAESYTFAYSLSDFHFENTTDGTSITPLRGDFVLLEDFTLPALPICYASILLPQNTSVASVSYNTSGRTIVPNVNHVINNPVFSSTDVTNTKNNSYFHPMLPTGNCYPTQNASLIAEEQYGIYRYATIQISPFTYYADSCLFLNKQINITIETKNERAISSTYERSNTDMVRRMVINPEALPEEYIIRDGGQTQSVDYVIITRDSLKQAFQPLAYWKTIKGVKTKIITLEEIYSNYTELTPQLQIKRCLQDYYSNHDTKWALLGGDDSVVPIVKCYEEINDSTKENIPCDWFYSCFGGRFDWNANGNDTIGELQDSVNFIPNLYISRLPIRTKEHVSTYVQKLLRYEQRPPQQNYVTRLLLSGMHLWNTYPNGLSDAQLKSELFHSRYIQPYWSGTKYRFYDTDTDFGGSTYDFTPENINAQLNTGYHFVHHASHGEIDSLPTETNKYSPNYVRQLEDNSTPSVFVTMACHTNYFDSHSREPCLSEAFIRHPNGAICYFGSSRSGWGSPNANPSYITLGPSFSINGVFFRSLFRDKIVHFAEIAANAKLSAISLSGYHGSNRWLQFSLNPIGDPELPIYTDNPVSFTGVTVTKTGNNLNVSTNGVDSCTIAVTSASDYGETYYNVLDNVSSGIFQDAPASYFVVVTKHNYVPYVYSSPLYIQNEIFTTDQTISNVDNVVVGESVTPLKPQGKVVIQSGGKLEIENADVVLDKGFEVQLGGELEIR